MTLCQLDAAPDLGFLVITFWDQKLMDDDDMWAEWPSKFAAANVSVASADQHLDDMSNALLRHLTQAK